MRIALMLMSTLLLSGCPGRDKPVLAVPAFPMPSAAVGQEINPLCFPEGKDGRVNLCPAFKNWIAALMKYQAQMMVK